MERHHLNDHDVFHVLRRTGQHHNVKLREAAQRFTTGPTDPA